MYLSSRIAVIAILLLLAAWAAFLLERTIRQSLPPTKLRRFRILALITVSAGLGVIASRWLEYSINTDSMPSWMALLVYSDLLDLGFLLTVVNPLLWIVFLLFLLLCVLTVFVNAISQGEAVKMFRERPSPAEIEEFSKRLIESSGLFTALRTALPVGAKDPEFGLDHIPFLLFELDAKKKEFSTGARRFLIATITLGSIVSAVVVFYGYVLLNEPAAGTPRILSRVERSLDEIRSVLPQVTLESSLAESPVAASLDSLRRFTPDPQNRDLHARVVAFIDTIRTTDQLPILMDSLDAFASRTPLSLESQPYRRVLNNLLERAAEEVMREEVVLQNLNATNEVIRTELQTAKAESDRSENRIAELLRRIAIGLIVTTFLLALLRYSAGLYREQYQQLLNTYEDDQAVRRFYVALKSSLDPQQRAAVLQSFLKRPDSVAVTPSDSQASSREELQIIKDIVNALAKKI